MKILDNKKDYYDYLVGVYGFDSDTVFDRRGSISLNTNFSFNNRYPNIGSIIKNIDELYYVENSLQEKGALKFIGDKKFPCYGKYDELHIIIGNFVYTVYIDRYKENGIVKGDNQVIRESIRDDNGIYPTGIISTLPISLVSGEFIKIKGGRYNNLFITERNVIFKGTWISKLFPAEKVWENIYDFLRSKKEKKIVDNRTDKEKILSAGFDVKSSFRNIKD